MPTPYKNVNDLKVAEDLLLFVNNELKKEKIYKKKLITVILKIKQIKLNYRNIKNF